MLPIRQRIQPFRMLTVTIFLLFLFLIQHDEITSFTHHYVSINKQQQKMPRLHYNYNYNYNSQSNKININQMNNNNKNNNNNQHNTRIKMAYDTIVSVKSNFEAKCSLISDPGVSLRDYMQLPVEQYVCIKMPLDATLQRVDELRFDLTVPPVRFFSLDVSPTVICKVTQTADAVLIESQDCILKGSPYVEGLNGCYKIKISTAFKWIDDDKKKAILSSSSVFVEVDPPSPFKYFGKRVLESTGTLAMSIALRQIENAFVQALARDYERWAIDKDYRNIRAQSQCQVDVDEATENNISKDSNSNSNSNNNKDKDKAATIASHITNDNDDDNKNNNKNIDEGGSSNNDEITMDQTLDSPESLTDDVCLVPGEPVVRIEEAPANSRRIFTGIDILAQVDDIWQVLTDYENLNKVVPSLVKNEVLERRADGGARLSQVGGAKVLPGVTFTAKTVLDVNIYTEKNPLPPEMTADYLMDVGKGGSQKSQTDRSNYYSNLPLKRGVFPRPYALTSLPHRDITMQNVVGEGDFDHYQGVWRMQALPGCAPDGSDASRLTYAVELRPKGFLPVGLIEGRIAADLKANLEAIKKYVEEIYNQRILEQANQIEKVEAMKSDSDETSSNSISIPNSTFNVAMNPNGDDDALNAIISTIRANSMDEASIPSEYSDIIAENRLLKKRVEELQDEINKNKELLKTIEKLSKVA